MRRATSHRRRCAAATARAILAVAVALALTGRLAPAGAQGEATPAPIAPIPALPDLAAMTLTPADLPEPGFALETARRISLAEEAAGAAAYRGQTATPEATPNLEAALTAAGWQARYLTSLALPSPDEPGFVAVRILSYVTLYASPDGAAAGFALLEDEAAIPTAADVPDRPTIGDESELTRDSGVIAGLDRPYRSLDLTFRLGNLTAGVLVFDNLDREPDPAMLEALAATLRARIETVLAGSGPGLGARALRLGGNVAIDFNEEAYERRDGQTIPYIDESPEQLATREQNYGGALDVYSVYQALVLGDGITGDDPYFVARLYRFPDEVAASTWLTGLPERLLSEGAGYVEATPGAEPTPLGDEAITISYSFQASQTMTTQGVLIAVRVGAVVARVQVDARPASDPAGVLALAETQATCLRDGACFDSIPAPAVLLVPGPAPPMPAPLDPS